MESNSGLGGFPAEKERQREHSRGGGGEEEKRETEGDRVSRFVWAEIE